MRWLGVLGVVGLLMLAVACGNDNNSIPVEGNFSNASLNGQYAYTLTGIDVNGFFAEGGVFTADGSGNITSATDDFSQGGNFGSNTVTGAYRISADGSGDLQLNFNPPVVFRIAMSDTDHLYLIQEDSPVGSGFSFGTGAGSAVKQNPTAFASGPSGTFVFQLRGPGAPGTVGVMTFSGGGITGTEDTLIGGTLNTLSITGSASAPGTNGRGTLSFTDSFGTQSFVYYVVNANTLRFVQTDGILTTGQAEVQTGGPFTNGSLSGSFVFGAQGDTNLNINAVHTVGVFSTDGSGGITGGSFDSVQDGNVQSNVPLTGGLYNVASNGRTTVSLGPQTGPAVPEVFWLVNPTRAFYLVNSSTRTEVGTADKQTVTTFSNATLKGQYAFFMDGFDSTTPVLGFQGAFKDRAGTFIPDGNGSLIQNQIVNNFSFSAGSGVVSPFTSLSGTYSAAANGRVTANVNALSSNIVLYMVSNSAGYSLQADTGVDIGGALTLQH